MRSVKLKFWMMAVALAVHGEVANAKTFTIDETLFGVSGTSGTVRLSGTIDFYIDHADPSLSHYWSPDITATLPGGSTLTFSTVEPAAYCYPPSKPDICGYPDTTAGNGHNTFDIGDSGWDYMLLELGKNGTFSIALYLVADPGLPAYAQYKSDPGCPTDPTPLPAALPLFATALGGLGLYGWRRKSRTSISATA